NGVTVNATPTEDFSQFCAGQLDALASSRALDPQADLPTCVKNGVQWIEMPVARNATVIAFPAADQSFGCLAPRDLYAALGPESAGIGNWQDTSKLSGDVGGTGQFDPIPLAVIGLPPDAPASALLLQQVIAPIAASRNQPVAFRSDYQQQTDPD